MLGEPSRPTIARPKPRPSQVRSGVSRAISLAHFALIFNRSRPPTASTRRSLVPNHRQSARQELALHVGWYNGDHPHDWLRSATPDELYFDRARACDPPQDRAAAAMATALRCKGRSGRCR